MRRRRHVGPGVAGTTKTSVELLLAEDVPQLGQRGEIVRVKPGYARNYLIPQGLATVATEENRRMVERHKQRLEALAAERRKQLKRLAEDLARHSVTIEAQANKEGHLYGSIGAADISKSLKASGFEIEPEQVRLEGPLKELAMYTVRIRLDADVEADVKVWVVPPAGTAHAESS